MNTLLKNMEEVSNVTTNAKGAKTYASSLNACVDFFGSIGSMRARSDQEIINAFIKAFDEDKLTALKTLFFARDIRGGLGERKVFRVIMKYLADSYPEIVLINIRLFSEFGRWDDLFCLEGTKAWKGAVGLIRTTLSEDVDKDKPTLLAKWLPSQNASSKETKRLATKLAKQLGLSPREYRKLLSKIRAKIKIVEQKMCSNQWGEINYEHVPSRAAMIYRNAFKKHDEERYSEYLSEVKSGTKEIKASTLYPYDIVRNIISFQRSNDSDFTFAKPDETLNLQWDALPNYVEPFNGLVIYDTSGSMSNSGFHGGKTNQVRPIDVALSLAIYIAERNTGVWQNCAIPFSDNAKLSKFKGSTIYEKLSTLDMTSFYGSTNLQSAFDLILDTAIDNKVSEDEMPKTLFVISDMQFNQSCSSNKRTNFEQIQKKYRKAGYEMPKIVFWNVNAYDKNSPVKFNDDGVCLVSGASPSILKSVLSGDIISPEQIMLQTINVERYDSVEV